MNNPEEFFTKIQGMVDRRAREIATEVYNELGTKYDVAQVPAHSHNGIDSNALGYKDIVQGEKYISLLSEDTSETVTLGGVFNPSRIVFQGFAANNAIASATLDGTLPVGNFTVTGAFAGGENSAILSVNWVGTTGIFQVTFSNGNVRNVQFTNGAKAISWSGVLTGAATATIHSDGNAGTATLNAPWAGATGIRPVTFSNGNIRNVTFTNGSADIFISGAIITPTATADLIIGASLRAILNGEINFGTCFQFNDLIPPITVQTNGPGIPFVQSANAMYVDSTTLSKNRVSSSATDFIYSTDDTASIFARATLISYDNLLGILTITFELATGVRIQGALTIT